MGKMFLGMFYRLKKQRAAAPLLNPALTGTNLYTHLGAKRCHRHQTMVASHFNGWVIDDGGKKRAVRYATLARRCRVPKGTPIADYRRYQPLKRLATSVKPLRGKALYTSRKWKRSKKPVHDGVHRNYRLTRVKGSEGE